MPRPPEKHAPPPAKAPWVAASAPAPQAAPIPAGKIVLGRERATGQEKNTLPQVPAGAGKETPAQNPPTEKKEGRLKQLLRRWSEPLNRKTPKQKSQE